jgi:hypothetical protein
VTASGDGPIHVALLSVEGRRVFARYGEPVAPGEDLASSLAGRRARFLVTDDGDHRFEVLPESWAVAQSA